MSAYHLQDGVLKSIKIFNNRIYSPRLGLEIVDIDENFRLFNPRTNDFLRSTEEIAESECILARRVAELEALLKQKSK